MRIQSHELSMSSQHTEYKNLLESKMSFETFLPDFLPSKLEVEEAPEVYKPECLCSYIHEHEQTLNGIIQSLIHMLQERTGNKEIPQDDGAVGYNHLSFYEKYEEHESLDFATSGYIVTDEGTLDINVNFSMTRSFAVENRIDLYTTFDPLVINLEGRVPELQTDTFSFDLDNDGVKEQISRLDAGSGFLALDKNHDGKINQGSELFGTLTGNGFGELSAYDEDHNNWIDENDSIYDSLQVWLRNENSDEKELVGLGEVGIGAIFLGSTLSEFTYKTHTNQTLGEMKSTGIFLHEDGQVGNISQIDFAKQTKEPKEPLASLLQA